MDTAQWPQDMVVKPMEDMISNTCSSSVTAATTCSNNIIPNNNNNNNSGNKAPSTSLERKVRPQKDQAVNCPRCNSTNTKFCYYNNYSLTQPRYFCKTCRRYWTEGGSLRNIPVGGGSRKNKRSSSSSISPLVAKKLSSHDLVANPNLNSNNKIHNTHHHQGQDLNLGFPPTHQHHQEFRSFSEYMQLPTLETTPKGHTHIPNSDASGGAVNNNSTSGANHPHHHHHQHHHNLSALELLNGLTSSRGLPSFLHIPVTDPNGVYSSSAGFPSLQDFKPSLSFSLDGLGNAGYGSLQGGVHVQQQPDQQNNNNGRLLFPFEDLKQVSSNTASGDHHNNSNTTDHQEQHREQGDAGNGYWSGMLGANGSW